MLAATAASGLPTPWWLMIGPVEETSTWSILDFLRTTRCYRTVTICAGTQLLTAEDPSRPIYATRSTRSSRPEGRTILSHVGEDDAAWPVDLGEHDTPQQNLTTGTRGGSATARTVRRAPHRRDPDAGD
jgi:hypothetical protein